MKKTVLKAAAIAAPLLAAAPAFAHDGDHSHGFVATAMHWLSSPTHSLFAVIGGVAVVGAIIALAKKRA